MNRIMHALAATIAFSLAGCGDVEPGDELHHTPRPNLPARGAITQALDDCDIEVDRRSLVMNQLAVVEDPVRTTWNGDLDDPDSGAWHFGRLMAEMAGPHDPAVFVERWLELWMTDQSVNGQLVQARCEMGRNLLGHWPRLDDGRLDLTRPPMRLLAIVNRVDLRDVDRAGEGRFVFGALDENGDPQPFTIILEYDLPLSEGTAVAWATAFQWLTDLSPDGAAYRSILQWITDHFSRAGADPGAVNGSAISQVRTNEIALDGPWQLREFTLGVDGLLQPAPVARTPGNELNGTALLAGFINGNAAAIRALTHEVPRPFLGSSSEVPFGFIWNAPGIQDNDARHAFALSTCNGCHGVETGTTFLHISPRAPGQVAELSAFMTGGIAPDPVSGADREFGDIARRQADMRALLCGAR